MNQKAGLSRKKGETTNATPGIRTTNRDTKNVFESEIKKMFIFIQKDMTSHKQFICDLRRIYTKMDHDDFMKIITSLLMLFMQQPEDSSSADTVLLFMCNFLASYKDSDHENPCRSVFNFVLNTDGANAHIRFRLCQLLNILLGALGEVTLDGALCHQILHYMTNRLKNDSSHVRAQAIYALERLQVPEDDDDVVIKLFTYHMQSDPSAKVREAAISKIARNMKTIPIIMERLQDLEDRVRRHTYIEMMKGLPVKSYRVSQRLTFLEYGLIDESISIRKIVAHLMITEWLVSYNDDYIAFLHALKLRVTDNNLQRYHGIVKQALRQIFEKTKLEKLLNAFACNNDMEGSQNIDEDNEESKLKEIKFCIPIEQLTLEHSVFWVNLAEYLYERDLNDIDEVLPDLSFYCEYLTSYLNFISHTSDPIDECEELERKYILENLINNLKYFDYSEDFGRNNLKDLISHLLKTADLNDHSIKTLVTITEAIIPDAVDRFPMMHNIILDLYAFDNLQFLNDRPVLQSIMQNVGNSNILLTISNLKINIMELKEEAMNFLAKRNYERAEKSTEELKNLEMEYNKALMPFVKSLPEQQANSMLEAVDKTPSSTILKCLKIVFFMLSSEGVSALTPTIKPLYTNFICRFIESNQMDLKNWALKCGITFALLHEQFAHDMFVRLRKQLFLKPTTQIWKVSISGIFQLLVRYDVEHFNIDHCNENPSQTDVDEDVDDSPHINLLSFMLHILDTCHDDIIINTVIEGFCILSLNSDSLCTKVILKLMLLYFDPATNSKANQLLGVFFKRLIAIGKSLVLETVLLPTINAILEADCESTLSNVEPKNVIRFVIKATNSKYCPGELNTHEIIAESFLKEIEENLNTNLKLVDVLSSELCRLHLNLKNKSATRLKFLKIINEILTEYIITEKIKQNLIDFKNIVTTLREPIVSEISAHSASNHSSINYNENQVSHCDINIEENTNTNTAESRKSPSNEIVSSSPLPNHEKLGYELFETQVSIIRLSTQDVTLEKNNPNSDNKQSMPVKRYRLRSSGTVTESPTVPSLTQSP